MTQTITTPKGTEITLTYTVRPVAEFSLNGQTIKGNCSVVATPNASYLALAVNGRGARVELDYRTAVVAKEWADKERAARHSAPTDPADYSDSAWRNSRGELAAHC